MSDANVTNRLEADFLPTDEMLKCYKELAPSLAGRLEASIQQAKVNSCMEIGVISSIANMTITTSDRIGYVILSITLMAPLSVLVSILYLIFSK